MDQTVSYRGPTKGTPGNTPPGNPQTIAPPAPTAPPMQIVTKGWWWCADEETTADELVRTADEQR